MPRFRYHKSLIIITEPCSWSTPHTTQISILFKLSSEQVTLFKASRISLGMCFKTVTQVTISFFIEIYFGNHKGELHLFELFLFSVSCHHSHHPRAGVTGIHKTMPSLLSRWWDLNSGPHGYTLLITKPSCQHSLYFFYFILFLRQGLSPALG